MSLSAIPRAIRRQVFERDGGRCGYCGLVQYGQASAFHVNHIIPRSRGGPTVLANLVTQCPHCSLHKSNKVVADDPATGTPAALYHPLEQGWGEHFAVTTDGISTGKTPTGRATVEALWMNDPLPRIARGLQVRLGLIVPGSEGA